MTEVSESSCWTKFRFPESRIGAESWEAGLTSLHFEDPPKSVFRTKADGVTKTRVLRLRMGSCFGGFRFAQDSPPQRLAGRPLGLLVPTVSIIEIPSRSTPKCSPHFGSAPC